MIPTRKVLCRLQKEKDIGDAGMKKQNLIR